MNATKKYHLYIDDSGTKEYATGNQVYTNKGGKSPYFVFGGLLIPADEAKRLYLRLKAYKEFVFGSADVEIKANWLHMPTKTQKNYLDKYNISQHKLDYFVTSFYKAIRTSDLTLFAAVIDKAQVQEKYAAGNYYPPAIAYECLMQRVVQFCRETNSIQVFIDDMDGATPKGNQYLDLLRRQHKMLLGGHTGLPLKLDYSPLGSRLVFVDSAKSQLMQVADTIAYNVHKQFQLHGPAWEDDSKLVNGMATLPSFDNFRRIIGKFCCDPGGRFQGYGIVKFPMLKRLRWTIEGGEGV